MATQPTQNAVPSESPRDLKFNAGKIDEFVTSLALQYIDRFGNAHLTIEGMKQQVLQQIYNLGWNLVGTFQDGATLSAAGDIIQDEATGVWYRWDDISTLPKVVPAGSTPESTGGIGEGKWLAVDVSDVLRHELAEPTGAGMIGALDSNGVATTVQGELNKLHREIDITHRKKKILDINWIFPDYNSILAQYGYSILIPQGLGIDSDNYYIAYTSNSGGGTNLWHWIVVYQRISGDYVRCFSLSNTNNLSFPESLYIRDSNGKKYLYTTANGSAIGYDITIPPENMGQASTTVFTKSGVSAFAPSSSGLACFMSDFQDKFVTQVDWNGDIVGLITLNSSVQALTGKSAPYNSTRTKVQSRTFSSGKLVMAGGAQFKSDDSNQNRLPAYAPSYLFVNGDGTISDVYVYNPKSFLEKLAGVTTAHSVENEGIAYSPDGKLYSLWYYEIQTPYSLRIFIVEEESSDESAIDLSADVQNVLIGGGYNENIIRSYDNTRFNPYTGVSFSNCEAVCELMRNGLIDGPLTLYVASTFYFNKENTYLVPSGTKIVFTKINSGTVFMECCSGSFERTITSTSFGQLTFNKVQHGGLDTDPWFGNGDFVIVGFNNQGVIATRRAGTATSTHLRFQNGNGVVGSIDTTANSTVYNTSSDARQKNIKGEVDGVGIIKSIIENGGVKQAAFKSEPENDYPQLIAQGLLNSFPSAVTLQDDGYYDVDYSKCMPVIIKAIHEILVHIGK